MLLLGALTLLGAAAPVSAAASTAAAIENPAGKAARRPPQTGEQIAVVFPDLGEPYRKVFTDILSGIEEKAAVHSYPIGAEADPAELQQAIRRAGSRSVIALGRQGWKAVSGFDGNLALVLGGVSSVANPEQVNGITLAPDPALLFARLRNLLPAVRRVIVVYHPQHSEALIRAAREAARTQGLELLALEASDLAGAVRRYESALAGADSRRDALWLPQDSTTVDETTVVPLVLRESWERQLPIFSSSLLHVRKGALFALYPDHQELGRELATLALAGPEAGRRGMAPLRAVRTAFNWRTAGHLGLKPSAEQQRGFDFQFPER